jgi:GNAT superfamily N-acetyltransferase
MKSITEAGHKVGANVGFDLAHAAGNIKLELHNWNVDFAAWCSYKYMNSGPGNASGCFIHEKHHQSNLPRFAGWWSQKKEKRFKMNIRKGKINDMPAVLSLIQELAVFEKETDAVVVTVADLERDGFGENPLFHTFVAEMNDEIIGMALYYYRYSTWKGKTIHLEDLIVKEAHRGTGAGLALYTEIIKQGKKDKVRRLEWNVLDWNEPAIRFYEKSGAKVLEDWRVVQMNEEGMKRFLIED